MTKKNKILSFILGICVFIPAVFMLSACGHTHKALAEWSTDETYHWHACEDKKCTEVLDKAEHTYGDWTVRTPAGCETDGLEFRACVCGKEETRTILATGHTSSTEYTYNETHHWHTCEECDELLDKAEHTWNEGVITTEATETTKAVKTYTCTVCEKTKTETVAKLDAGLSFSDSYNPSKVFDDNYADEPELSNGDYTCASDGTVIFTWYEKVGNTYSSEPLTDAMGLCPATNAGTYKLVMSVAETKNYASAKVEKEVVISPKPITISNTNLTKVYGTAVGKTETSGNDYFALDEILSDMITETEGLINGDELYLLVKMSSKNVGSTIVSKKLVCGDVENTNYILANADDITAEITKKEVTGNFDLSTVYTGGFGAVMAKSWNEDSFYNQEFAELFVAGDKVYIYKGDVCDVTNGAKEWTNATLYGDNAGNYDISKLTLTYQITPATLTFTQATITKEYDTTSTFTYTFTTEDGLKNGTTCTLSFTVKDADDNYIKNAGEYTNFVVDDKNATLSNNNYQVDYSQSPIFTNNGGKIVITPKVITELNISLETKTGTSAETAKSVSVGNTTENVVFQITVTSESVWNHATELTLVLEKPLSTQAMIKIASDTNYTLSKNFVGTLTITDAA